MSEIKVAVLTVSDRCARNESEDLSGPALIEMIDSGIVTGGKVVSSRLVPDDVGLVESQIKKWCDEDKVDVVLTTGGTGLGPRDVTPEATVPLVEKLVPGIPMLIFKKSSEITSLSALSRGLAGVRGKSLIVNLPGSKKAATECLEAIARVLPHASDLICDRKDVSTTHSTLHATRKSKVSAKNQKPNRSPYKLTKVSDAQQSILDRIYLLRKECRVPLEDAFDFVLAEDVVAHDFLPPFDSSLKDGYAIIGEDAININGVIQDNETKTFAIIGSSYSGSFPPSDVFVEPTTCVKISTGARMPEGANAVVQVEDTTLSSDSNSMHTSKVVKVGENVRPKGFDFKAGELLLKSGSYLNAGALGLLAAAGISCPRVLAKPTVAVFSTGNELVEPNTWNLPPGKVRDSNRISLINLFKNEKFSVVDLGIVSDDPDVLCDSLDKAFRKADVVVTTGSMSMGDRDYLKEVLVEDFDAELVFGRVFMKPGMPTGFALVTFEGKHKAWFGLPGNPASAVVTAHLFVLPSLRKISGHPNPLPLTMKVSLEDYEIFCEPRPNYQRGILFWDANSRCFKVKVVGNQSSSGIASCALSNCFLLIPSNKDAFSVKRGSLVEVFLTEKPMSLT